MRLTVDIQSEKIKLKVKTTKNEDKVVGLPIDRIHYWYPFNINFFYKYSDAKKRLYLAKEKGYEGENYYEVEVLKRSRPLAKRDGIMFHPQIYRRNRYIINKARRLGLATIDSIYTESDVEESFNRLSDIIQLVKQGIEDRVMDELVEQGEPTDVLNEDWDALVYGNATEEEEAALIELGEMYTMLTVMRKVANS